MVIPIEKGRAGRAAQHGVHMKKVKGSVQQDLRGI
jgi:hypothetical protein